jgi:hypothetical protein
MARPVGEELARNPTAISRPKGGWFARIWTQRAGSVAGNLATPEKIYLDHANPFTIWVAGLRQPHCSGQLKVSSNAFTVWTKAGFEAAADPLVPTVVADSGLESVIDPLPAGVFEEGNAGGQDDHEMISGEDPLQKTGAVEPVGKPTVELPAHCFTIWTTAQALDCQVVHAENSSESSLIGIQCNNAFTLWTDGRYNSKEPTGSVSSGVDGDCIAGEAGEDLPGPVAAEKPSTGRVGNLVAMAALFLLLIGAMFVISAKNKEVSDIKFGALEEKKEMNGKINDLKHDKQELKAVITAAKENHAKESTALQTQLNQLEAHRAAEKQAAIEFAKLNQIRARAEQEGLKKALNIAQADSDQARNDAKKAQAELEQEMKRRVPIEKELNEARKAVARLGEKMDLDAQKMAQAGKALEEARAQMTAGKSQLEQSEKKSAQLAAEVKKLKAQVDDLKTSPAQPPAPTQPPESKPGPAPDPVPEAEPKESPKDKPDKGPINV